MSHIPKTVENIVVRLPSRKEKILASVAHCLDAIEDVFQGNYRYRSVSSCKEGDIVISTTTLYWSKGEFDPGTVCVFVRAAPTHGVGIRMPNGVYLEVGTHTLRLPDQAK